MRCTQKGVGFKGLHLFLSMAQELSSTQRTIIFGASAVMDMIILDQVSKWLMIDARHVPLLGDWLSFTYAENKGIAFSMPLQGGAQQLVTIVLIVLLIGIVVRYKTWRQRWLHYSLMLILGGALGNAIDRIYRGYVVDFIQVGSFPVFNIADSCVTLGVVGVIIYELIIKPRLSEHQTMMPPSPPQP